MAVVVAAPVWAQNVTAPGLIGQPACRGGYVHNIDGNHLGVNTSVINGAGMQGIFTNNFAGVTYSFLRGRVGGDSSVSEFPLKLRLINSNTGAQTHLIELGTVTSTTAVGRATNNIQVAAKTPYTAIYYADVTGLGEANPINSVCFMTGGTYATSTLSSGTSGCFSISPRTPFDVRNCLCGRSNLAQTARTSPTIQPGHTDEMARRNLGCDAS
ncbi:MAG: hypothetical protein OXD00_02565 [Gammaproteobacteria bacterium]|nr:hypothetical protein [Gammaproteobacteria bacterium]